MKNQLVSHPQVKLKVVHRNTELHTPPESWLTGRLKHVYQDLDEIASMIEKEIDRNPGEGIKGSRDQMPSAFEWIKGKSGKSILSV